MQLVGLAYWDPLRRERFKPVHVNSRSIFKNRRVSLAFDCFLSSLVTVFLMYLAFALRQLLLLARYLLPPALLQLRDVHGIPARSRLIGFQRLMWAQTTCLWHRDNARRTIGTRQ